MIQINGISATVTCGVFLTFITLSACSSTTTGNAENGEKWYKMNNCNACHGEKGDGGGRGPDITHIDMSFGSFVKKLRKKNAPIMPPYPEEKISEHDAADIFAYLKNGK